MVVALSRMTLAEFLSLPDIEASPAWELINLEVVQNPLPTVFLSRLQKRLLTTIDRPAQAYEALPELRCVLLESSVFLMCQLCAESVCRNLINLLRRLGNRDFVARSTDN
jgi:hypothetical protein